MPKPARTRGNYRDYTDAHRQRLSFIRHARGLGFDITEIRSLLDLSAQPNRDCIEADRIASGHLEAVEAKIERLRALRAELARIVGVCPGGRIATCHVNEAPADHSQCSCEHPMKA